MVGTTHLLLDYDGSRFIYGVNVDGDDFGQETTEWVGGWDINDGPRSISAGDLNGDFQAEVVGLWDGEWGGWYNAYVAAFTAVSGTDGGEFTEREPSA